MLVQLVTALRHIFWCYSGRSRPRPLEKWGACTLSQALGPRALGFLLPLSPRAGQTNVLNMSCTKRRSRSVVGNKDVLHAVVWIPSLVIVGSARYLGDTLCRTSSQAVTELVQRGSRHAAPTERPYGAIGRKGERAGGFEGVNMSARNGPRPCHRDIEDCEQRTDDRS